MKNNWLDEIKVKKKFPIGKIFNWASVNYKIDRLIIGYEYVVDEIFVMLDNNVILKGSYLLELFDRGEIQFLN